MPYLVCQQTFLLTAYSMDRGGLQRFVKVIAKRCGINKPKQQHGIPS
tara:strand:- start:54 stop:194 length:141 start_codon:yes stop_codon:yes gene_type:complete